MGIQSSSAVLKAYFETGDVPTSAQFGEFIDSTAYYDYSLEKLFLSEIRYWFIWSNKC